MLLFPYSFAHNNTLTVSTMFDWVYDMILTAIFVLDGVRSCKRKEW